MKGIVYVGHGSRLQEGNEQFIQFIQSVMKERNERIQKLAFLELTTPTISDAVTETIIEGATEIMIVPVLLFAAAHYKRDIPLEIAKMKNQYPHISFSVVQPFSTHPHMVELVVKRIRETMPMQGSSVLLVGEVVVISSRYMSYNKSEQLSNKNSVYQYHAPFNERNALFTAELKTITSTASHVYVMPYLLFTGLLLQKLSCIQKIRSRDDL